jgi:hypothetical protein
MAASLSGGRRNNNAVFMPRLSSHGRTFFQRTVFAGRGGCCLEPSLTAAAYHRGRDGGVIRWHRRPEAPARGNQPPCCRRGFSHITDTEPGLDGQYRHARPCLWLHSRWMRDGVGLDQQRELNRG